MKTVAAQGATAFVLLLFCPQLGVGPLLGQDFIMDLFMHFGPLYCSAFCGAFFLGTATLVACVSLKREELRVIYRYRLISISLITALAISGLMLAGGEANEWSYIFWTAGALLGALLSLSGVTKIRSGSHARLMIS